MSIWFNPKGKTYASTGPSDWLKYHIDRLTGALRQDLTAESAIRETTDNDILTELRSLNLKNGSAAGSLRSVNAPASTGEDAIQLGRGTVAASPCQAAKGKFNLADSGGKYAEIVGNGSSDTERSNAYTLDWEGNASFAGTVSAMGKVLATADSVEAIPVKDLGTFEDSLSEFDKLFTDITTPGIYKFKLISWDMDRAAESFLIVGSTISYEEDYTWQMLFDTSPDDSGKFLYRRLYPGVDENGEWGRLWSEFQTVYPRLYYGKISDSVIPTISVKKGGTGATTAENARANLGAASQTDFDALAARVAALEAAAASENS